VKTGINYQHICFRAMEAVREAALYVREKHENRQDLDIEVKGRHNFVTEVDKRTEEILVEGLSTVLPEAGFIAEEGTSEKRGDTYNWVIDPVDGTTNFIHGVFPFAISVGLIEGDRPVVGIVHEFGLDEIFYGWEGGGAWLRRASLARPLELPQKDGNPGAEGGDSGREGDKRLQVSRAKTVEMALIATGFPYTDFTYLDGFIETVRYYMEHSQGLRRLGSAATDMAYVACGRYDGFYEYGLHPWDIAAGILLIREAGGKLTDFQGVENPLFKEDIVCSNGHIQDEFLASTRKIMFGA
jgi:myo-inositol-1(or 4)-monophosphatase